MNYLRGFYVTFGSKFMCLIRKSELNITKSKTYVLISWKIDNCDLRQLHLTPLKWFYISQISVSENFVAFDLKSAYGLTNWY